MLRLTAAVSVASLLCILAAPAHADDMASKPDQVAVDRPAIDLAFDFHDGDSVETVRTNPEIAALGKALSDPELKKATFMIACHVKVPGSPEHNWELSERCADLVKQVLVEQYGLPPQALVAVGYGETQLKNPADPMAPENQRLHVLNMGNQPEPKSRTQP
jgi:outer membrane protein OmpA-like peptidoglycan-associated protein